MIRAIYTAKILRLNCPMPPRGGGAKNRGMHKALEDRLGMKMYVPQEPQFVIALGAALIAKESLK